MKFHPKAFLTLESYVKPLNLSKRNTIIDSSNRKVITYDILDGFRIMYFLVIVLVCPSVFKHLRDCSLVFPETLHEVRGQLSKKSDTTEILKGGIKCQKFWFFTFSQKVVITSF